MKNYVLSLSDGFDPVSQRAVGLFAAQLDDQSRLLKASVAELGVPVLEWQPRPGMNTIGMLLAHIALCEAYWMLVCSTDWPSVQGSDAEIRAQISDRAQAITSLGMDDDGIPQKPGAGHPETLRGKTVAEYFAYLDAARDFTKRLLRGWSDADLDILYNPRRRDGAGYSRAWTVYHILEHLSGHYGQILLLRRMARDTGVWQPEKEPVED
jgi:uncharacterized damage-inducible protein DinB